MDISTFIDTIRANKKELSNSLHEKIHNSLIDYLRSCYRASFQDAQDAAQDALISFIEAIKSNKQLPEKPVSYLKVSAKNAYLKLLRKSSKNVGDHYLEELQPVTSPEDILADKEMIFLLKLCITKLEQLSRKIIEFFLENPGVKADIVGAEFNLSVSNVWVKKHRIYKQLEQCVRKKM